jgi:ABC-type glutathione transport system ATPase component
MSADTVPPPLLQVQGLAKQFVSGSIFHRVRFDAVKDVSFTVNRGTTYGLVGESGSGKSTVARMVARLATPTAGSIRLDGKEIGQLTGSALKQLRRDVQMVFQDPYSALNPRMTVEQLVTEPFRVHGLYSTAERRTRARRLLDQVGMPTGSQHKRPVEFSGGQRQRIMIARALALDPRLIIADEPVSALDVSVQAQVLNLFKDLQDELGLAYLFISHDMSVVEFVSDHLGVMRSGELVEAGPARDVLNAPQHEYTQRLLAAIPELDMAAAPSAAETPTPPTPASKAL